MLHNMRIPRTVFSALVILAAVFAGCIGTEPGARTPTDDPAGEYPPLVLNVTAPDPVLIRGTALLLQPGHIVIDAKSGVSGAGRAPTAVVHHAHTEGSVRPYRVGNHQHTPEIELILELSGLRQHFAAIVAAEDVGVCKPDPCGYHQARGMLDLLPKQCLVIEDSLPGLQDAVFVGGLDRH
jgi:hypothetical protein